MATLPDTDFADKRENYKSPQDRLRSIITVLDLYPHWKPTMGESLCRELRKVEHEIEKMVTALDK